MDLNNPKSILNPNHQTKTTNNLISIMTNKKHVKINIFQILNYKILQIKSKHKTLNSNKLKGSLILFSHRNFKINKKKNHHKDLE